MENFRHAVNRFFQLSNPSDLPQTPAIAGSPASRAPLSEARKSEILATPNGPCKRYFDEHQLRLNWREESTNQETKSVRVREQYNDSKRTQSTTRLRITRSTSSR
jgi:hypothetical protein